MQLNRFNLNPIGLTTEDTESTEMTKNAARVLISPFHRSNFVDFLAQN